MTFSIKMRWLRRHAIAVALTAGMLGTGAMMAPAQAQYYYPYYPYYYAYPYYTPYYPSYYTPYTYYRAPVVAGVGWGWGGRNTHPGRYGWNHRGYAWNHRAYGWNHRGFAWNHPGRAWRHRR